MLLQNAIMPSTVPRIFYTVIPLSRVATLIASRKHGVARTERRSHECREDILSACAFGSCGEASGVNYARAKSL